MIYLNIGSNLNSRIGSRKDNIKYAIKELKNEKIRILKVSNIYETPSYPNLNFPKFLNISVLIKCEYTPEILLKKVKLIEKKIGRIKRVINSPRVCDIDIIDFNGIIIKSKFLTIPHPKLHKRNFVLYPMRDINPNWKHPITSKKINKLISELNLNLRIQITKLLKNDII
ncbi:MAG: 2-amino-4-hydroxy-6-hydroxymethyldihydropteridine diphosphokinase [Pelagibacteraceae bacterium TMED216]|mgnify:CR=1 FL=1|nr:MAG: 2-amino-4-hydroxy-6-hydroxymethyldihydropteridine diphosphokinase [Pelagibacteraceae bacterium TMED216]|tara:strand:- start:10 stop:519 length:510 start_codon:yes stop_codon:yes gene_type:complete